MSLKHGLILWASGSLTAFLIVGVFWTIFRNELDAARYLAAKADATFAKTEQGLRDLQQATERFEQKAELIAEQVDDTMGRIVTTIHTDITEGIPQRFDRVERGIDRLHTHPPDAVMDALARLELLQGQLNTEVILQRFDRVERGLDRLHTHPPDTVMDALGRLELLQGQLNTEVIPQRFDRVERGIDRLHTHPPDAVMDALARLKLLQEQLRLLQERLK